MSKLNLGQYSIMMEGVSDNLKNEIKELSSKVNQARESENWGTYKNLILAYKEIVNMYNDIAIDVCERDTDKTQYINTTISLDKDAHGIITKAIEGMLPANRVTTKLKTINIFDEKYYMDTIIQRKGDSLIAKVNMSKLLSKKLTSCLSNEGTLINVQGLRGIGKTYELIKFARENHLGVIVANRSSAEDFKDSYDYSKIYYQTDKLLIGMRISGFVVDEGVDVQSLNDLGLNIVTGYINK